MKYKSKRMPRVRILALLLSFTLLALFAGPYLHSFGGVGNTFDNQRLKAAATPDGTAENYNYYDTDYSSAQEVRTAATALNREVASEGFVLLKNDDYLPMKPSAGKDKLDVSLFGKNAADIAYFGFGSSDSMAIGGDWTRASRPFYQAFDNTIFNVNPTLKAFYEDNEKSGAERLNGNLHGSLDGYRPGLPTWETPYEKYTDDVKKSYGQYNDAAIVMLTRIMGEGSDLPKTSLKGWGDYSDANKLDSARYWDDHYLQLDANEVKMLQEVMDNFDNVIILLNSSGPMEVGFLQDPTHYLYTDNGYATTPEAAEKAMNKIKAAMLIGLPGTDGCFEIPRILAGEVNPSGHLSDTWVLDMKKDPTWQNQGYNGTATGCHYGAPYVHYDEDIYLGYRYYETRYATEKENGDTWYAEQVQFPFGYGMSYTDFEWELVSSVNSGTGRELDKFGSITTKVKVTNVGNYPGKEVVQLYYNTPYYPGGISKAHVVLGGFDKTKILKPGESEIIEIKTDVSDMYSYDWSDANVNGFKGYELEAGDYNIVVAPNAHEAAKLPENFTTAYSIAEGFTYEYDTTTGAKVGNLFDNVSGSGKVNDPETFRGVRRYMSRDNFEGTFPTPAETKKSGMMQQKWTYTISPEFDAGAPWYSDNMPTQAAVAGTSETNKIKLWHLRGRDYDDPLWDALLDQLTVKELVSQIENGFFGTRPIASIDKPMVYDDDGPLGRRHSPDVHWVNNPTLAQTFNADLAYAQGVMMGEAALWGMNHAEGSDMMGPPGGIYGSKPIGRGGTYGLGLNTHRSPFGGRNFEYFSECGVLGGKMGAKVSAGSNSKGCYQISKHIMLNDQETERGDVQTWASEQAIREIYGKAFEIAIKEGGLMGLMAGINYIGDTSCSQNWALLTGLVRNEWGFHGFVITDLTRLPVNMCIRAGCNTMMVHNQYNPPATDAASLTPTHLTAIRESAKSVLYTIANSNGVQGVGGAPLNMIDYGGANTLYAVEGVDNSIAAATAKITIAPDEELQYSLPAGEKLPEGMTIDRKGVLKGAPTESGEFTFTLNADEINENAYYPYQTASKTFKLKVFAKDKIPENIIYEDDNLGIIPVGFEFSQSIKSAVVFDANGKLTTDVRYSLTADSELPEGLTLKDGVVSGICTAAPGKYFFTVIAESEGKIPVELDFIVRVRQYEIKYATQEIEDLQVGESAFVDLGTAVSEDGLSVRYALKDGDKLPEGLALSSIGVLTGTPVRAYTDHEFTVVARADLAMPTEVTYKVTVLGIEMSDKVIDELLIGKKYSFRLEAKPNDGGETGDITYEVKKGTTLPSGFKLSGDGILTGVGTDTGAQSFTVVITAEGYQSVEAKITLNLYNIYDEPLTSDIDGEPLTPKTGCSGSVASAGSLLLFMAIVPVAIVLIKKATKRKEK